MFQSGRTFNSEFVRGSKLSKSDNEKEREGRALLLSRKNDRVVIVGASWRQSPSGRNVPDKIVAANSVCDAKIKAIPRNNARPIVCVVATAKMHSYRLKTVTLDSLDSAKFAHPFGAKPG